MVAVGGWRIIGRMERARTIARIIMAVAMVVVGIVHFVWPAPFVRIVPPFLPAPLVLVYVSGAFEIALGLGLLVERARRWAGLGLIALYLAVFPANLYQALEEVPFEDGGAISATVLWLRLPLQLVFIAWAWWVSRPEKP